MAIPAGYTPLDYVGFTDRGAYANNVTYVINDIVDYRGEKWKCKVTNTINVIPGENANWTIWIGAPVNLVERIIAPLEENPATIAYGVGRQIIYDDYLFEVIKQINVGDTLVVYDPLNPSPSANIKLAPPVETQVLAIKAEADATDDMIAPTETNASASSQPYGVGEQLILNNVLYTVTSAIAQNGPLVTSGAGQNLAASKTLTDQLADKADNDVVDGALALKANKTDIARIEGATMSKGYAIKEQFYHGGTLYTALKTIANGAAWSSLVENTDYEESNVNSRLKNINDALNSEITTRSSETQALTTQVSTNTTNIANTAQKVSNSSDEYSASKAYKVGELCIHDDKVYRCTQACSAASWAVNQNCFTQDTLTNAITYANNKHNNFANKFSIGSRGKLSIISDGGTATGTTFAQYLNDMGVTNEVRIFFFFNMTNNEGIGSITRGLCIAVGAWGYDSNYVYCLALNSDGMASEIKKVTI